MLLRVLLLEQRMYIYVSVQLLATEYIFICVYIFRMYKIYLKRITIDARNVFCACAQHTNAATASHAESIEMVF